MLPVSDSSPMLRLLAQYIHRFAPLDMGKILQFVAASLSGVNRNGHPRKSHTFVPLWTHKGLRVVENECCIGYTCPLDSWWSPVLFVCLLLNTKPNIVCIDMTQYLPLLQPDTVSIVPIPVLSLNSVTLIHIMYSSFHSYDDSSEAQHPSQSYRVLRILCTLCGCQGKPIVPVTPILELQARLLGSTQTCSTPRLPSTFSMPLLKSGTPEFFHLCKYF